MVLAAVDQARGLREEDFRLTCRNGFGDGWNHYPHSMAWFHDRLYVGTTRATFAMLKMNKPVPAFKPWPIECPDDVYDIDRRAEIWEYTPETEVWRLAYRAPQITGKNGRTDVPRYIGYRGMAVFQGKRDTQPCLYVASWAPQMAGVPHLLRSEDGQDFEVMPALPFDASVRSFRTLQIFQGRLHTTPTGSSAAPGKSQDSVGSEPTIFACDDPQSGVWREANARSFGEPDNLTIFEMAEFDGHLYAATVNPKGFQLWKTPGGELPYRWTKVLERGAGRGSFNEVGGAFCAFKGALYMGTGVVNGGYHRALDIGPAAAEVLRVWPDDSWDLLVGNGRLTPQGLKYPLSGHAEGFNNLFNGYVWRMAEHRGHLYAGTLSWACLLPYMPLNGWPEDMLVMLNRNGHDQVARRYGGFGLWRTADGVIWESVTRTGFGNHYNWGVRNFASTRHGLFVGAVNPFGPKVAVRRDGRWQYVPNPRGGAEIWLGEAARFDEASNGIVGEAERFAQDGQARRSREH